MYFLKEGKVAESLKQMGKKRRVGKIIFPLTALLIFMHPYFLYLYLHLRWLDFFREKWHWWKFERNEGRQAKREREKLES